jgi:hypothetical protein
LRLSTSPVKPAARTALPSAGSPSAARVRFQASAVDGASAHGGPAGEVAEVLAERKQVHPSRGRSWSLVTPVIGQHYAVDEPEHGAAAIARFDEIFRLV